MADVLFRGMEMPKNCGTCKFAGVCDVLPASEWPDIESIMLNDVIGVDGARDKDCPLIEAPPHGRLTDADELERGLRQMAKYQTGERQQGIFGCCETIRLSKTIIPASKV